MAIAFTCPQCSKEYKVKDDLAGKTVTCKECEAPIRVPAPVAIPITPAPEAESLAEAVLAEAPAAEQAPPSEIEFECPRCIETVKVDVKFAGKQTPCPNCRHVVRVPQLSDAASRNWRAADHRPTLAKREAPDLTGHWGSTTHASVVSRDALAEADALRKRRPRPGVSPAKKIAFAAGVAFAALLLVLIWRSNRAVEHRDDFLKRALASADANSSPAIAAEVRRAAGEYYLRAREPNLDEADKQLRAAREKLPPVGAVNSDKSVERLMLLAEIATTQAVLCGDATQVAAGTRVAWTKMLPELRRTLSALVAGANSPDGVNLGLEGLVRVIGLNGDKEPIAPTLIANVFGNPADRIEPLAIVALEFAARGSDGREKSVALAGQIRSLMSGGASVGAKTIALHVVLDQLAQLPAARPPGDGEPSIDVRLGFAEGHARRGEIETAQRIARLPGRFEDRFAAESLIASVLEPGAANQELAFAVDLLTKELGSRDLPDWALIRLAQTCGRAASPSAAPLFAFLQNLANLSPRSQAVRAWAQYELLRSGAPGLPLTEEALLAMTPTHTAGSALAWEALGRRLGATGNAPASTDASPESIRTRALALAGIALGLLEGANK